ncbi:MAG: RDD family protein [Candidatus Dormibacteria bacterium]
MLSAPDTLRLRTAENVGIDYRIAGIGSRFLARLLDELLLLIVELVLLAGGGVLLSSSVSTESGQVLAVLLIAGLALVGRCLYFVILEWTMGGQTPGKRRLGIRVVRAGGGGIGFTDSLIRNLVRAFEELLLFAPTVVSMFADRRSRRLGDFAAGTIVVHERRPRVRGGESYGGLAFATAPVHLHIADAGPPIPGLGALGQHEHSLLRSFLARLDIHPVQRQRLAADMGAKLCDRMCLAADSAERRVPPELLLERIYMQLSQRLAAGS